MQVFPRYGSDLRARVGRRNEINVKEIPTMTRTLVRATLFVFALTMSVAAFAGSKSETVVLYGDTQISGKTLPAGEYTVKYEPSGSNAQVKFLRNGKEVATANGQMKQLTSKPDHNQVITQDAGNSRTLSEIDFSHSGTGVTFDAGSMTTAGTN